jgi:hypothetical protein
MGDIELWKGVTVVSAAVGQTLFVLLYVTFPWYRTFLGRALFIKAVTFAVMIDVAVAGMIWDWEHEHATLIVMYGCTAFGIWAQLTAFSVQRFGNKDQDSTEEKREYHHGT